MALTYASLVSPAHPGFSSPESVGRNVEAHEPRAIMLVDETSGVIINSLQGLLLDSDDRIDPESALKHCPSRLGPFEHAVCAKLSTLLLAISLGSRWLVRFCIKLLTAITGTQRVLIH